MPTFIITYNPHNPQLKKCIILLAGRKVAKLFPRHSVSFRQPKNLKQILCHNTLKQLPYRNGNDLGDKSPGSYKYYYGGRGRMYMLCPRLREERDLSSSYIGLAYNMRHHLTCKSKYVVYLITCLDCRKRYLGKTSQHMHQRMEIEDRSTELQTWSAFC